jgi:putative DNA-invertase from lambdoid prophage Rac
LPRFDGGPDRRIVTEIVSGASAIPQRKGFMKLLDKLDEDDVLIVTKMDRLGRNAIDVKSRWTG